MGSLLTISSQRAKSLLGSPSTQQQKPLPSFTEIARSLRGDDSPCISVEVPPELVAPQSLLAGTAVATMMSTQLWQDVVTGTTYLDMVTTFLNLVSLRVTPTVVDHPMSTLEGWEDSSPTKLFPPATVAIFAGNYSPQTIMNCHSYPTCVYIKHSLSCRFVSCYTNGSILFSNM